MAIQKVEVPLEVRDYGPKGRGICVLQDVPPGTVLERFPVLVIDARAYRRTRRLPYRNHTFVWDKEHKTGAIGFGFASLCNHSLEPNAVIRKNQENAYIELIAQKRIPAESEVTILYNNAFFEIHE